MGRCIGTCSLCGGEVMAYIGVWMSILPPPPPKCSGCGAHPEGSVPRVIPMVPAPPVQPWVAGGMPAWDRFWQHSNAKLTTETWAPEEYKFPWVQTGMLMPDGKWRA